MRLGIISEGTTEQAVIENILVGLGVDSSDVIYIRPDLNLDETDLDNNKSIGTWQGVKNACIDLKEIEDFLNIDDNQFVIVQIDTAECGEVDFGITRPEKGAGNYALEFRDLVAEKISTWLTNKYQDNIIYAICIEEIEAWILTIFTDSNRDTSFVTSPKEKLYKYHWEAVKKSRNGTSNNLDANLKLTKDFRKKRLLKIAAKKNASLEAFITEVETRVIPHY